MNRGVAVSVVQKPCAFHPAGATQAFCESVSKIPGKNLDGCCSSNCPSKFRVCRVCVTQNETGVVTSPKDGLCKFHRTNGEASHRASSARVTEDSRSLGWVSTTPSVKKIVTVPKSPNSAPAIRSTAEPVEVIRCAHVVVGVKQPSQIRKPWMSGHHIAKQRVDLTICLLAAAADRCRLMPDFRTGLRSNQRIDFSLQRYRCRLKSIR